LTNQLGFKVSKSLKATKTSEYLIFVTC